MLEDARLAQQPVIRFGHCDWRTGKERYPRHDDERAREEMEFTAVTWFGAQARADSNARVVQKLNYIAGVRL